VAAVGLALLVSAAPNQAAAQETGSLKVLVYESPIAGKKLGKRRLSRMVAQVSYTTGDGRRATARAKSGEVILTGLKSGSQSLKVSRLGFDVSITARVIPGVTTTVQVDLPGRIEVPGPPNATVEIRRGVKVVSTLGTPPPGSSVVASRDVPPGIYTLVAKLPGHHDVTTSDVVVGTGSTVTHDFTGDFAPSAPAVVREPLRIEVLGFGDRPVPLGEIRDKDNFEMIGLPGSDLPSGDQESVTCWAHAAGYKEVKVTFSRAEAHGTKKVALELLPGSVAVLLSKEMGNKARICLESNCTDAQVGHTFIGASAGKHNLKVTAGDAYLPYEATIVVEEGKGVGHIVTLKPKPVSEALVGGVTAGDDQAVNSEEWYEKWWVWTIVGVVAGGGTAAAVILAQDDGGGGQRFDAVFDGGAR